MPLYPYRCTKCGYKFEKIQSFSSEPERECPKCQGVLERPLTAPGLHFKGAGWYVNDYAGGKSSGTAGETAKSSEKAEAATPCGGACGAACPAVAAAAPATTGSTN